MSKFITSIQQECTIDAYVETALFHSQDKFGARLSDNYLYLDIDAETLEWMKDDVLTFLHNHAEDIFCEHNPDWGRIVDLTTQPHWSGVYLWRARNGIGEGFLGSNWPEAAAQRLQEAAEAYGEFKLIVGDDERVYEPSIYDAWKKAEEWQAAQG